MRLFSLAFLLGVCSIFYMTAIPNLLIMSILIISILVLHILVRHHVSLVFLAFCLGIGWVMFFSYFQLEKRLPKDLEGKTLSIVGDIVSLPEQNGKKTDFVFKVTKIVFPVLNVQKEPKNNHFETPMKVKLNWYGIKKGLHVGDQWQLQVRLKRPHGFRNPGSMDYEKWLFQKQIGATGYVVSGKYNKKISSHWYYRSIMRFRQKLKEKIDQQGYENSLTPFLSALLIGDRQGITQDQWRVFRRTGTSHLIAIAGLHIGLIAGFVFFVVSFLWKRIAFLTRHIPAQQAAAVIGLVTAFFYSALAGFSLPTQRALIMSSVFFGAIIMKRRVIDWYNVCLALLLVLLINPLSVLDTAFWLSFACVTLIVYGLQGRLKQTGIWWKWGRLQWAVTIGLLPLVLWSFHETSYVSPIANMIVVPWFGFIVLPLCFLGMNILFLSESAGHWIIWLAVKNLQFIWMFLEKLAHLSLVVLQYNIPNIWLLGSAIIAVIFILTPRGFPGRYLSFLFLLPLMTFQVQTPKQGELWFTLLDVGQGLSSVVRTQHHTLIFDAGPRFSKDFDAGSAVILPYLQFHGIHQIDKLIISHGDDDHVGGVLPILSKLSIREILSSVPHRFDKNIAHYCHQGQHWVWDGIQFDMLSPEIGDYHQGNNSSCVLKITVGDQSVLLTGDIEKSTERKLWQKKRHQLSSTVLIAPHHGSKTSSTQRFVEAVHPKIVLFPIGYRNRFRFPHHSIVRRYQNIGVKQYDTAHTGAISFKMTNKSLSEFYLYRERNQYIWSEGD